MKTKRSVLSVLVCIITVSCALSLCACNGAGGASDSGKPAEEERVVKTLMVGDSLFDLWKDNCVEDLRGVENLVNVAVGGTSSIYWQKSQKILKRENPTTIIMSLGTNDIADLNRIGECAARGGDNYEQCLQGVLEMFKETIPDVHIYLLTINICGENIRWNKRAEIIACNRVMREYCEGKDWVEMVETEYAFYDDDNYDEKPNAEYFVSDYLHFSRKGYIRLREILRKALKLDK